jgi:hypothetical protein
MEYNPSPILMYDYAISGVFTHQLSYQIDKQFLRYAGQKPTWAPWESKNSLFSNPQRVLCLPSVTWIGINDMGVGFRPQQQLTTLFKLQEWLYEAGARYFIFINIPPTDRSPAGLYLSVSLRLSILM